MKKRGRIDIIVYTVSADVSSRKRLIEAVKEYYAIRGIRQKDFVVDRISAKPKIKGIDSLECSVSHSGTIWLCAFSEIPVGIDIEKEKEANIPGISGRFFHADENEWLKENGYKDFFSVWTAKESYVKCLGKGITDGFDEFSVVDRNGLMGNINGMELRHIYLEEGYRMCLCTEKIEEIFIHDKRMSEKEPCK